MCALEKLFSCLFFYGNNTAAKWNSVWMSGNREVLWDLCSPVMPHLVNNSAAAHGPVINWMTNFVVNDTERIQPKKQANVPSNTQVSRGLVKVSKKDKWDLFDETCWLHFPDNQRKLERFRASHIYVNGFVKWIHVRWGENVRIFHRYKELLLTTAQPASQQMWKR